LCKAGVWTQIPRTALSEALTQCKDQKNFAFRTDSHDSFERREAQGRSLTLKVPSSVEAINLLRVGASHKYTFKKFCQFFEEILTQMWMNPS
jgi:hypothetical protein